MQRVNFAINFAGAIDRIWLVRLRALPHSAELILPRLHRGQCAVFLDSGAKLLPGTRAISGHYKFVSAASTLFGSPLLFASRRFFSSGLPEFRGRTSGDSGFIASAASTTCGRIS